LDFDLSNLIGQHIGQIPHRKIPGTTSPSHSLPNRPELGWTKRLGEQWFEVVQRTHTTLSDNSALQPPHIHIAIKAMEALGRVNSNTSTLQNVSLSDFSQVQSGQLGFNESGLPPQDPSLLGNNSLQFEARVAEMQRGKPWPLAIAIEIANRYMQVAFCSWYSTGGSIPGVLEQLSMEELNITGQAVPGETGNIFEKFNLTDVDAAGGGGELGSIW
jgi:hypothetical protein